MQPRSRCAAIFCGEPSFPPVPFPADGRYLTNLGLIFEIFFRKISSRSFQGGMVHRDSMGLKQQYGPNAVQWMSAGRGILHEEMWDIRNKWEKADMELYQIWVSFGRPSLDSTLLPTCMFKCFVCWFLYCAAPSGEQNVFEGIRTYSTLLLAQRGGEWHKTRPRGELLPRAPC